MKLTTEDLGEIPDVDSKDLDEVLRPDGFGKFAILGSSDQEYIQAGKHLEPGVESQAFLQEHDSDPWVLEYCENRRQFRATRHVALEEVLQAFKSYLTSGSDWRSRFKWAEVEL